MADRYGMFTVCDICFDTILNIEFDDHIIKCKEDQIEMLKKYNNEDKEVKLTTLQDKGLKYAEKKSKIISRNVYLEILAKYKYLGYTEDD